MNILKTLNKDAAKVLLHLIELANKEDEQAIKLGADAYEKGESPFMSVCIEILYSNYSNTFLDGYINVSVAHYGECNGDLMRDPEMCFLVKDDTCIPYYFRNDYGGKEQELIDVSKSYFYISPSDRIEQRNLTEFADIWMKNIDWQQDLGLLADNQ